MGAKKSLGELLVMENLISIDQLEAARKDQRVSGGKLVSALVRKGYVSDGKIAEFLGQQYGIPAIDLSTFEINPEIVKLLPKNFCEKHAVIPVSKSSRTLVVAFSDPSDVYVKDDISILTKCKIEPVISSEPAIKAAIEKYYGSESNDNLKKIMSEIEDSDDAFNVEAVAEGVVDTSRQEDAPIIKFVNAMLTDAIKLRASDIHVEPYEKRFRIRFRIDGTLYEKTQPPPGAASAILSRLKIISKMDIAEKRKPQDGRLKVKIRGGKEIDFRVNSLPTLFGEKIVLRLLDKSNLQVDLDKLGFEDKDLTTLKSVLNQPQGMILVTGPTGSGKTTTLYSGLTRMNVPTKNISTAENPVEFNFDGINQVQINHEIGFTFAEALRSFLRQDPDVIMLGEIRDYETAEIAFKAASTGHLVLSTLHTNDAPSTVTRLIEMGMAPYLVAETVSLIIAQRLVKKNCTNCTVSHSVTPETLLDLGVLEEELHEFNNVMRGEGCERCNGTGLAGRKPVFEVMELVSEIKHAILKGSTQLELKKLCIDLKMSTLRRSALSALKRGETSVEQVINVSVGDDV